MHWVGHQSVPDEVSYRSAFTCQFTLSGCPVHTLQKRTITSGLSTSNSTARERATVWWEADTCHAHYFIFILIYFTRWNWWKKKKRENKRLWVDIRRENTRAGEGSIMASKTNCCLQCRHPILEHRSMSQLYYFHSSFLQNALEKAAEDGPSTWVTAPTWMT